MTDTLSSTNSTTLYRSPYPNRHPKLGVSAVLRSASVTPLTNPQPKSLESPLRLDDPPSVTCRFRPGLRPVRIIDMANFRFKRKQLGKSAGPDVKDIEMRRSSTLLLQSRRQPLKAFQQNTLPPNVSTFNFKQDPLLTSRDPTQIQGQPTTIARTQRISTNPKIRRYNSSDMATSKQCTDDYFAEHIFVEVDNSQSRKRRSMPIRPSKKLKSRDSLDSVDSNITSVRGTHSSTSTPTSTMTDSATTKQQTFKTGVMTRIRSQTQLAYEAVKRVVRRHSKRRSDSYELRRDKEIY
ncbi:unnamed protein product [Hymenolepis diminuta]|uniref:Uncharacterized protein n=1 Tax=Hymenolepis diminuta TaxID=6216 RepID=A0A0R3SCA7_HYMDI|nr:unnamed protein product [Hymenolepis diminuta]VUZ55874.1 unnamed protein product [Hymenolepis diminuta]